MHTSLKTRLRQVIAAASSPNARTRSYLELCAMEIERWRLVAELIERQPFRTPANLPRSEQWRRATSLLRDAAPCPALLDWLLLQTEVASNLEKGVRDMRPRKDGPCHGLALAYARQRLAKAETVHAWAETATASGADFIRGPSRVFGRPNRSGGA